MKQILILMYHIVAQPASAQEAQYCCTPRRFEAQMRHLGKAGLQLLTLDAIADALDGRASGRAGVAVAFDGCRHVRECMPILTRYRVPRRCSPSPDRRREQRLDVGARIS